MIKTLGLIGIVISSGLIGIYKSSRLKLRIDLLDDYYKMILCLKSQMNYFKEPLPDMFSKISQSDDSKAFYMIKGVSDRIDEKVDDIGVLWANMANQCYENCPLTNSDMEIIEYIGKFLGQTDYQNQMQHFEYVEEKLKAQLKDAYYQYNHKSPMFNKIGFFIGSIIAIIFI